MQLLKRCTPLICLVLLLASFAVARGQIPFADLKMKGEFGPDPKNDGLRRLSLKALIKLSERNSIDPASETVMVETIAVVPDPYFTGLVEWNFQAVIPGGCFKPLKNGFVYNLTDAVDDKECSTEILALQLKSVPFDDGKATEERVDVTGLFRKFEAHIHRRGPKKGGWMLVNFEGIGSLPDFEIPVTSLGGMGGARLHIGDDGGSAPTTKVEISYGGP